MEVIILPSSKEVGALAADAIEALVRNKSNAVIGLATGSSPLPIYDELARRHDEEGLNFTQVRGFALDEYVGLPVGHYESYREVIRREFTNRVDVAPENVHGPDGASENITAACQQYEDAIVAAGGIDLQILGVGTNGHIGFNEPGSSLASRTRIKTLAEQTRQDNARFFDNIEQVPHHVVTQGLGTIMDARHLVLVASGAGKADAVRDFVEGPVSASCPGSILQFHPRVTVIIDEAAAAKLAGAATYRHAYDNKPVWQGL
ncbi:glucosamine-6-phosphate deaminase [Arthrobacter alpinus]|uniref:Glucosamine-6-phosphate deaminase n=1 Tax=Arthrobacter alpinus TaxID=656366 RepID=A0A1H5ETF8_9MICC|nr:glucosamine-6-phosphate deaminase [Arthrobacter alpinus]SED94385.1 glucosamine-6-phosphate deaminase [Arthrobacter alpinus]